MQDNCFLFIPQFDNRTIYQKILVIALMEE